MQKHDCILLSANANDVVCYTDASIKCANCGIGVCIVFPWYARVFAKPLLHTCMIATEFLAIQLNTALYT